jgi:hypothetical protein
MGVFKGFSDCDSIEEVVGEAVGAGSTCWTHLGGAGVFQSELAGEIVEHAVVRIRELIIGANVVLPETEVPE